MPPLFSVITITKNNPRGFDKTKKSVQAQAFDDYEWIIVDGDKEPDKGIYDAMNKGMGRAVGRYIVFMNAGDAFYDTGTLALVAANHGGADFVYGDCIDDGRYYKKAKSHKSTACGMFTHHQAMYYRREALRGLRYDLNFDIAADYKFTAEFVKNISHVSYIPAPLCVFAWGGVSCEKADQGRKEQAVIRRQLGIYAPLTPYRQKAAMALRKRLPRLYYCLKNLTVM